MSLFLVKYFHIYIYLLSPHVGLIMYLYSTKNQWAPTSNKTTIPEHPLTVQQSHEVTGYTSDRLAHGFKCFSV